MGNIAKSVNRENDVTVYTAVGTVTGAELKNAILDFYEHGPVTRNVLWDVTLAELTKLHKEDIRRISMIPREQLEQRQGGKTAIVAPADLAYGLGRMYQSSTEAAELPFEIKVFRYLQQAQKWLAENPLRLH